MKFAALTMVVLCLVGCGKTTLDSFPTGPAIESPDEDQITELRLTAIRDGKFVEPHRSSGPTTYFYAELVAKGKKRGRGSFRVKADVTIGLFSTLERCDAATKTA